MPAWIIFVWSAILAMNSVLFISLPAKSLIREKYLDIENEKIFYEKIVIASAASGMRRQIKAMQNTQLKAYLLTTSTACFVTIPGSQGPRATQKNSSTLSYLLC